MYVSAFDREAAVLLGLFSGEHQSEADYARADANLRDTAASVSASERAFICVCVVDAHSDLPSPKWRKRFAETAGALTCREFYFAMVTSSALVRGIHTAIVWLVGTRPGHKYIAVATLAEAQLWLESRTGSSYAVLADLEQQARRAVTHGS